MCFIDHLRIDENSAKETKQSIFLVDKNEDEDEDEDNDKENKKYNENDKYKEFSKLTKRHLGLFKTYNRIWNLFYHCKPRIFYKRCRVDLFNFSNVFLYFGARKWNN
jgi:spore coat polysaccharide biosynthesis predicted glycosyltransferase SpsG